MGSYISRIQSALLESPCLWDPQKFSSGHSHPSSWSMDPSLPQPSLTSPFWGCVSAYPAPWTSCPHILASVHKRLPASQMVSWFNPPMNSILLEFKNHIHIRFFLYFPRLVAQCQTTSTWIIGTCGVGGNKIYIHLKCLIRKNDWNLIMKVLSVDQIWTFSRNTFFLMDFAGNQAINAFSLQFRTETGILKLPFSGMCMKCWKSPGE